MYSCLGDNQKRYAETACEKAGSTVGKEQNRERSFALKMASIRDNHFIEDDEVCQDGGNGKKYSHE